MKRDWNIYFGTTNSNGVKICGWAEDKQKHNSLDKVICICPECEKYFTANSINDVTRNDNRQIKRCRNCSFKYTGQQNKKTQEGKPRQDKRKYIFNIGDIVNDNLKILNIYYKNKRQYSSVKCLKCEYVFDIPSCKITRKDSPKSMCTRCSYKQRGEKYMKNHELNANEKYGLLTTLFPGEPIIYDNGDKHGATVCLCECGNIVTVKNSSLKSGQTKSCGCLHSWLEAQTAKFLTLNGIHFTHGLRFPDILTDNGNPVEFDFQIEDEFNNHICFIECQGEQHYKDGDFGRQQREETDIKKKNYCTKHNIILYEIRYDDDIEQRVREILTELNLI